MTDGSDRSPASSTRYGPQKSISDGGSDRSAASSTQHASRQHGKKQRQLTWPEDGEHVERTDEAVAKGWPVAGRKAWRRRTLGFFFGSPLLGRGYARRELFGRA